MPSSRQRYARERLVSPQGRGATDRELGRLVALEEQVAIDGPAGSGKSTTGLALARRLRWLYLDTGAMYRAVALIALREGVDADSESAVVTAYQTHALALRSDADGPLGYRLDLDRIDVTDQLTAPAVTSVVSVVAAHPRVRAALVERQREIAREGPVVMAGRDIGTVVLPNARYKFYLTASLDARAHRRAAELAARGVAVDVARVREELAERDRLDETRATAPLRPAPDAVEIDATGIDASAVVDRMLAAVQERRPAC